ncbi:hypothetical protein HDV63DRAFT_396696 [Trichoderma sp. SZMC 28014]
MPRGHPRNAEQPRAKKRKRSDQSRQNPHPTGNTNNNQNPPWSSVPPVYDLAPAPDSQYAWPASYTAAAPYAGPQQHAVAEPPSPPHTDETSPTSASERSQGRVDAISTATVEETAAVLHTAPEDFQGQPLGDQTSHVAQQIPAQQPQQPHEPQQPNTHRIPLQRVILHASMILRERASGNEPMTPEETARYSTLYGACINADLFFLIIHRYYSWWLIDKSSIYGNFRLSAQDIDRAFGQMRVMFKNEEGISPPHRLWFSGFPELSENIYCVSRVLSQIQDFILALSVQWPEMIKAAQIQMVPLMEFQIREQLNCPSLTMANKLFIHSRRIVGVPDNPFSNEATLLFNMDQKLERMYAELNEPAADVAEARQSMKLSYQQTLGSIKQRMYAAMQGNFGLSLSLNLNINSKFKPVARLDLSIKRILELERDPLKHTTLRQIFQPLRSKSFNRPLSILPNSKSISSSKLFITKSLLNKFTIISKPFINGRPFITNKFLLFNSLRISKFLFTSKSPYFNLLLNQPQTSPVCPNQVAKSNLHHQVRTSRAFLSSADPNLCDEPLRPMPQQQPGPRQIQQPEDAPEDAENPPQHLQQSPQTALLQSQATPQAPQFQIERNPQQDNAQPPASQSNDSTPLRLQSCQQNTQPTQAPAFQTPQRCQSARDPQAVLVSQALGIRQSPVRILPASQPLRQNLASQASSTPTTNEFRDHFTVHQTPPTEYPTDPHHWTSVQTGLHLTHLRSPRRVSSSPDTSPGKNRYYQFLSSFVVKPTEMKVHMGISELKFSIEQEDLGRRPIASEPSELPVGELPMDLPVSRHFNHSQRYRLRMCGRSKLGDNEGAVSDPAKWVTCRTNWPPHTILALNGEIISPLFKQHYHKDLPIELTHSLIEGMNTIKVHIPSFPQNIKENLDYFMAVELILTLDHDSARALVTSAPHVSVDETKAEIKRRLQLDIDDEIIIHSDTLTVSVADSFSSDLFDLPVRGRNCRHLECIDLENWLGSRPRKPSPEAGEPTMVDAWGCPICGEDARPGNLQIDDYFVQIRDKLLEDRMTKVNKIQISVDGTWEAVEEADANMTSDKDGVN